MSGKAVNSNNPYVDLWNEKVLQNSLFFVPLVGLYKVLMYIVCARFIVTFAHWLLRIAHNIVEGVLTLLLAAGKCAESLFIICTFYVLCYMVARSFLVALFGQDVIMNTNHIVLIVFTALPELILLEAIKTSVERVYKATQLQGKACIAAYVWAGLTILPTLFFVVLTVYTLASFAGSTEHNFDMTQLTGFALLFRILPGWCYAIINGLYEKFGSGQFSAYINGLKQAIIEHKAVIEQRDNNIQSLEQKNELLRNDVALLQSNLRDIERELMELKARKQARKTAAIKPEIEGTNGVNNKQSPASASFSERATASELGQTSATDYSVTESVAAELLGVPLRSVSRLVRNETLKHAPNSQKITMSSIEKYAQRKGIALKRSVDDSTSEVKDIPVHEERNTDSLPVTNGHNGHKDETVPSDLQEMLV
jgi:hypothetical protein